MRIFRSGVVVLFLSLLPGGCGPSLVHSIDTAAALQDIERQPPTARSASNPTRPLTVTIEPAGFGGVAFADKKDGQWTNRSNLHGFPGRDPEVGLAAERTQLQEEEKRRGGFDGGFAVGGYLNLQNFAESFAGTLKGRLAVRMPQVIVKVGTGGDLHVQATGAVIYPGTRDYSEFTLKVTATPSDGSAPLVVQAQGRQPCVSSSNLYWMVPIAVITFPVGTAVMAGVWGSWTKRLFADAAALAMDDAAAKLGEEILGSGSV